ncbi:MAG: hypothetical protein J3R72DRAFT_450100 [Linnemannia gamsii]|nr:MAG: hypothetical protein J3R72DRAFT_450100 [Linnemannia gamsii]
MASPRKIGILVAIPIKGRKLVNRSGGKQSPYIQLTLSSQKKRTKASLIASVEPEWDQEVRLDVFQGMLNMGVSVFDEGKKNELIGEGTLLLHEVIDKGELDVWFPIKYKGAVAGDIYFELTFYAVAPPPQVSVGTPPIGHPRPYQQSPLQRPGFVPPRPLPHVPPANGRPFASYPPGPPALGYIPHQHPPTPVHTVLRPYPVPQNNSYPPSQPPINGNAPYGRPPMGPGFNPMVPTGAPAFRPSTQYTGSSPQGQHAAIPHSNKPYPPPMNTNPPVRYPVSQYSPSGGIRPGSRPGPGPGPGVMPSMPIPQPYHHSSPGHGQRPPMQPRIGISQPPLGSSPHPQVTPMMQYNYSLGGSFP